MDSIVKKIGEVLLPAVKTELEYVLSYGKHMKELEDRFPDIESASKRIEIEIKKANDNNAKIYTDIEHWEKKASQLVQEAQKCISEAKAEENKSCFCGLTPNFLLRHQLARKANMAVKRISDMLDSEPRKSGKNVSYTTDKQVIIENEGYQAFRTRRETFKKIMAALKEEDKTRKVLVYGMAGTGKTMLANEIAKQVVKEKLFDPVIFTAVSQKPDYKKIQDDIAAKLKLETLKGIEKLEERAFLLRERLANDRTKVLIILDDLWEELQLSNVGIHFGDNQAGCKILVTSRFQHVLQNDKRTTQKFQIENLSDDESFSMFNNIVGDKATESEFQELAAGIVDKCGNIPLAISLAASALRDRSSAEWNDALANLKSYGPSGIEGMENDLFNSIRFSYDFLDKESQALFLLCCMREEDVNMDLHYMLTYSFGLGIYRQAYSLKEAIHRFRPSVSKLKDHSLILKGSSDGMVKVHDLVRDFGIFIAKQKAMYTVRNKDEFSHFLREKTLQNATALSLLYDDMGKLPEKLDCPLVELLWMWKTGSSKVPDLFFEGTKQLKILDLSYSTLQPLPSSFGFLESLRVLNLCDCTLDDISGIGQLKLLLVLDLTGSSIKHLPKEIGQLSHLRELEVGRCKSLKTIDRDVLPNLEELEELNMKNTAIQWEDGDERKNASLTDLQKLPNLKALHLDASSDQIELIELLKKEFSRYEITVTGTDSTNWYANKLTAYTVHGSKILKLNLESSRLIEKLGLGTLLESSEEVQFFGMQDIDALIPGVNKKGFRKTKHMSLYLTNIQWIISPLTSHSCAFEGLESLRLHTLEKLAHICHRKLSSDSFCKLQQLEIVECHQLKSLFSYSVAKLLVQLQEIYVKNCSILEEIITHDGQPLNNAEAVVFPQLKKVQLLSLPELKTFFNHGSEPSEVSPVPLFSGQVLTPKLAHLEVYWCESVKCIFSSSFASGLLELDYVYVKDCSMVEEIITTDQKVAKEIQEVCEIRLPKLQYLQLQNLPKVKKFCSGTSIKCPVLTEVYIWYCNFQGGQNIIFASDDAA